MKGTISLCCFDKESGRGFGHDSLDDLRGDGLAGTAPGGEEVDDHQGAGLSASGIEVGLAVVSVSCGSCMYSFAGFLPSFVCVAGRIRLQRRHMRNP